MKCKPTIRNDREKMILEIEVPREKWGVYENADKKWYDLVPWKKAKSLQANAYLWELCTLIARKLCSTKEEIYRKAISETGMPNHYTLKVRQAKAFAENWESIGTGWVADVDNLVIGNYQDVKCYKGSSVYNQNEMNILLSYVVEGAKELGIETREDIEVKRMIEEMKK